jgi:hypothetical protein
MEDFISLSEIEMLCAAGGRKEEDMYEATIPYGIVDPFDPFDPPPPY